MNEYLGLLDDAPEAPKAPAGAPKNDYLSLLDNEQAGQAQRLQSSLATSVSTNPDAYAAQKQLAKYVGVPPIVAQTIPDEIKRRADVQRVTDDTAETPILAGKYGDRDFAQLAHDDSGPLSAIESAIRYLVSAPDAPRGGFMSDVGKAGRSLVAAGPGFGAGAYGAAAAPFEVAGLDTIGGWLRAQQKSAEAVSKVVAGVDPNAGFIEQSVLSGFQSAGQNLLTLPLGFAAKGEQLMLGAMGLVTGGQSYGKARDAGLAPAAAAAYGIEDAAAEIVTEKFLGAAGFLKQIKAGASAGKLFGYEVLKEVPGEIGATLWQNFNEWGNVNPDKTVADFIAEQPEAIAQTIIATLVGGSVQIGAVKGAEKVMGKFGGESAQAAQAQMSAQQLDTIAALAQASKLKERSPETFQQFAQELADAHTPAIFVDAQALMQSGVNIQEVAQAIPSVAAQLQQAVATGGDIEIPTAEFVQAVPGSTFQQQLIDHARTGANAMSRAEADVFMKDKGDAIKAEIEAEAARHEQDADWQMQRNEVRDGFEAQLNAAGRFQPAVNKSYAAVLGDFYAVTASRAGMTPKELVQRYPLRIQATAPGGAVNAMEQGLPYQIDHKPMTKDGGASTLDDLTGAFGEDIYGKDALQFFGSGDAREKGVLRTLKALRGKPDAMVTIYRGVPAEAAGINPGDWVTISKEAAQDYADQHPDGKIVSMQVPASHVTGWADSLLEFGYHPQRASLNQSAQLPATIYIDGQQRPTTNSKGQQIAATEEGVRAFYRWFKDSTAVDADGRPLVLYHGTDVDFTEFDKGRVKGRFPYSFGFHFTDRPSEASIYASDKYGDKMREGGNVMPVYVRGATALDIKTGQVAASMEADLNRGEIIKKLLAAKKSGEPYDSVVIRRERGDEWDGLNVIVFDPTQIKSAISNSTFDPANPSILNQSAAPAAPTREEIDLRKRQKVLESLLECLG